MLSATDRPLDSSAIFQSEFRYVWNTLRRLGVHERDLEDVAHEVFIRVHAQLPLFDRARPLRAWLFGIVVGVAANYRRLARHRKIDLVGALPDHPDPGDQADEGLERREESHLVHAALQKVPLEQRAVLVMHELDGYPIPEVAVTLGLGLNTAYSRLRLGREAFRTAFRRLATAKGPR
ncbi:MAG TPA: RNA polymerase sigma factor [Polyangiaceae bacterium]|nr:RNA polymerase sigma factor [Polyangiaceae bacterium]